MIFTRILLPILVIAFLSTAPLQAQTSSPYLKEEKGKDMGVGFNFSPAGFLFNIKSHIGPFNDQDRMPFPIFDVYFRYNAYQGSITWAGGDSKNNEFLLRLTSRYNWGLRKQSDFKFRAYPYGGIDLWYFDRWKTDPNNTNPDRPFGRSIIFGLSAGYGAGLYFGGLGLSIEPGITRVFCNYEDLFCGGWFDAKVGIQISF